MSPLTDDERREVARLSRQSTDRWITVGVFVAAQLLSAGGAYIATSRNVSERIVVLEQQIKYLQDQMQDVKYDLRRLANGNGGTQ